MLEESLEVQPGLIVGPDFAPALDTADCSTARFIQEVFCIIEATELASEAICFAEVPLKWDMLNAGSGFLPAHESSAFLARVERRVSERLAEAGDFIRHTPRTLSSEEASGSFDGASADRSRLQQRLRDYSLCERVVKGDGNCQVLLLLSTGAHADMHRQH